MNCPPVKIFVRIVWACVLFFACVGGVDAQGSKAKKDQVVIVHAGTLLAVPGEEVRTAQTIVVRNGRIESIRDGYLDSLAVEHDDDEHLIVVDWRDEFVMPGLMDAHVHLARASGSYASGGGRQSNVYAEPGNSTVNALINARLNLAAGFTTLRDLGSGPYAVFAVRDAIAAGKFAGPDIIAAGPSISVTGGHTLFTPGADPDERARAGICDGADDCRRLTRYLEKQGADVIKFKSTGGFSSNTGLDQHMYQSEMRAIIDAAHQRGLRVTTHAYDPDAIREAVEAGVDSIEHGYKMDDAGIRLMKKTGAFLVPTLTVAKPPAIALRFMPKGEEPASVLIRNEYRAFERAYEAGVNIAFGTDCGIYPHGRNADEFVSMVRLGMTPMDALRSATVANAILFGVEHDKGTLEAGKIADLIAVVGDPLADIAAMRDVIGVIKSGRLVKQDTELLPLLDLSLPQRY